jgi:hypothetical protein
LQISAANLLVAGQQPTRAPQPQAPQTSATATAGTTKPAFAPLDFKSVMSEQPAAGLAATQRNEQPVSSDSAGKKYQRPGSLLDIRI